MYALFLETHACKQIDAYVAEHGGDAEAIKKRAYEECLSQQDDDFYQRGSDLEEFENWWVDYCLHDNRHRELDIDSLFTWEKSLEGKAYWQKINAY